MPLDASMRTQISIPFESSRGCWWGAKHRCKFCGLNNDKVYRSRSSSETLTMLNEIIRETHWNRLAAADTILNQSYYGEFLTELSKLNDDAEFFFEVKSNLTIKQMEKLNLAGVNQIQPGIESFSNNILNTINKGVSVLQNIRILKTASWMGIDAGWNIMFGFPGETKLDYENIAIICKSIMHLEPPNPAKHVIALNSPFYLERQDYGISIQGIEKPLAVHFPKYSFSDGHDPDEYYRPVLEIINEWRNRYFSDKRPYLKYYRLGENVLVEDSRDSNLFEVYKLDKVQSWLIENSLDILDLDHADLKNDFLEFFGGREPVEEALVFLEQKRLICRDSNCIIALPIPSRAPASRSSWLLTSISHGAKKRD
jgi:radical SAM superfamily enzyme YgiQ (UPF0313 family)